MNIENKKDYLVIGLESSCTRFVSKLIAINLGIIANEDEWDGHKKIENDYFRVTHQSLPHGDRDNYMLPQNVENYDEVVICLRDFNCSLISKNKIHQPRFYKAYSEHVYGMRVLRDIYNRNKDRAHLFSHESSVILGQDYVKNFLNEMNIDYKKQLVIYNVNKKYLEKEMDKFVWI